MYPDFLNPVNSASYDYPKVKTFIFSEDVDDDGADRIPRLRGLMMKTKRLSTSSIRYAISYIHRTQCPKSCDEFTDCDSCSKHQLA